MIIKKEKKVEKEYIFLTNEIFDIDDYDKYITRNIYIEVNKKDSNGDFYFYGNYKIGFEPDVKELKEKFGLDLNEDLYNKIRESNLKEVGK